jgi:hypothetical protein
VNTAVSGTYTVTYLITDSAGNKASRTRTVTVLAPTPTSTPTPTLLPTSTPNPTASQQIAVTVLDTTLTPIKGASVSIFGIASTTTDDDGVAIVKWDKNLFENTADFPLLIRKDGYVFPETSVRRGGAVAINALSESVLPETCSAVDSYQDRAVLSTQVSKLFSNTVKLTALAQKRAHQTSRDGKADMFKRHEDAAGLYFADIQTALLQLPSRTVSCTENNQCQNVQLSSEIKTLDKLSRYLAASSSTAAKFLKREPQTFVQRASHLIAKAVKARRIVKQSIGKLPKRTVVCE